MSHVWMSLTVLLSRFFAGLFSTGQRNSVVLVLFSCKVKNVFSITFFSKWDKRVKHSGHQDSLESIS